ncbi:Re/Si-specific NAD(P)(+) transhydrogenase subunit alpha [Roseospirillum parvum]|uniref:NAD(P) transhydrogenase subunit alpha part 1 n=1 Tax=Roseospirillum parvum TaxID=83401 RepID=A0A1G8EQ87_9PROT|nr:Re/Si-specific NAD(P)(+) transhydrogenase subunit alpha [Roseospirillum parvum]SDH72024.1 NAD(P) transhydrogenase subunit alpha [Roseospirillum parvum]
MKIAIPKERRPNETRVAASPDTVKKYVGFGFDVAVEKGAGAGSSFTDEAFKQVGATIAADAKATLKDADIVLKVARPMMKDEGTDEVALLPKGATLVCQLAALQNKPLAEALAKAGVDAFAMELMPRISRAQSMDILSSQSNLSGYKAVVDAAAAFTKCFPMMMTAAGTVAPARVLVFGAGVAGLQAIATAKRMGAVVYATDVRPATREQVESLGGKFVVVDEEAEKQAETAGGYAKDLGDEYRKKQAEVMSEQIAKADIIITTALIPGKPAPKLVTAEQVKSMKTGSVIVDLAGETGGNCELTEYGKTVTKHDVTIISPANMPATVARDASTLFAKNLLNFLTPFVDKEAGKVAFDWEDDLVKGTLIARDGKVVHSALTGSGGN